MKVLHGLLVLAFKLHSLRGVGAFLVSNLYPFGKETGDTSLPIEDDLSSRKIKVPPFSFYGSIQNTLYVSENGLISFGRKLTDSTPARFPLTNKGQAAVPYWADVYTPSGGQVWYRLTTDRSIISRATKDVIRAFPVYKEFEANWVFIATWSNVTFYGASPSYKHKRNTFQAAIATDGDMSFIAYIYRNLTWTTGTLNGGNKQGLGGTPAQIGFSSGNTYYKLPGSGTAAILELAHTSNCGQAGVWFFRVDDVTMIDKDRCESMDALTVFPTNSPIRSGDNIAINGLCYRPTTGVRCDFGDVGAITGYYFSDTAAFCTVPFVPRPTQISLRVILSESPNVNVTQTMTLEPIHFLNMHVKRLKPRSWTIGSHVNVTWNPLELADQPVTLEIMTFIEVNGAMKLLNIVIVVREKPNTGRAEFDIPQFDNTWNITESQRALSFVRVRGKLSRFHTKYARKQWMWSDLFSLTNQSLSKESCARWHKNQSQAGHSNQVGLCPDTLSQLLAEVGRFTTYEMCNEDFTTLCEMYQSPTRICYRTVQPSPRGFGYKCCYGIEGRVIPGLVTGGNILTAVPGRDGTYFTHFVEDIQPYLDCCVFSNNCAKFYGLRRNDRDNESSYSPPRMAASYGDPHILTFDGVEYTFNGFGEYTVLEVDNNQFTLQGRMQALKTVQSRKSPATVFTAFVMKQKGASKIQVQRGDQDSIEVLVDGIKKPIFSGDLIELPGVLVRQTPRGNNSRVIIIFNSGITVYIENAVVLQMAVSLPSIFKGTTRGLLGHWNDNREKEFLLPNGKFLSSTASMSDIHHLFGQKWATEDRESLFTYGPDKNHMDYSDKTYVPTFMDNYNLILAEMNETLLKRAHETCDQSPQCMFDIGLTGRLDIGKATKEFQEWLFGTRTSPRYEGCKADITLEEGLVRRYVRNDIIDYHFSCNEGYVMNGKEMISCTDGLWDGSKPICQKASGFATPVFCRSLDVSFANGVVSGQGTNPGDRYKFTCNKGFLLIGKNEIVCGKDGSWSAPVPFCKIGNCSWVSIDNARVRSQNDHQLVITCNHGYILVGPRVLSCEVDGSLNGTLSSCIRGEQRRKPQAAHILPVIVIGVVVIIVAMMVIVVTVYLVRKHRKRKTTRTSREMTSEQKGTLV